MSALIRYEAALVAIAACAHVDECKDWADKAAAMQAYNRMAKDKTLEVQAAEIRIRAERRLGELILLQKETVGLNAGGRPAKPVVTDDGFVEKEKPVVGDDRIPTLADAGISKDMSSRAQALAKVPAAEFEQEMADWRDRTAADGARVSARLVARGNKVATPKQAPAPAASDELARLRAENDELRERNAELARTADELLRENESFGAVVDSDDRAKEALAQLKAARAHEAVLQSRIDGLQNECSAHIRHIKALQRQLGERK
jgi:hypothetical protein